MLQFLVGIGPLFVGFMVFGVFVFAESTYKFASFSQSAVTLFSLSNGGTLLLFVLS